MIDKNNSQHTPQIPMRTKINIQPCFPLFFRIPKEVVQFRMRYDRISAILDENMDILEAVHAES